MATLDKMLRDMRKLGLKIPESGSGSKGKILNSDVEKVLAEYYAQRCENDSWGWKARLAMREVMLSYRFDKLSEEMQLQLFEDDNDWIAEEKYDGCRMIVTYEPEYGFGFYGRNRERGTYLPVQYTVKILINGRSASDFKDTLKKKFILDAEILTDGYLETKSGSFTGAQLNAAVSVLQLNEIESHLAQKTSAPLTCVLFDWIPMTEDLCLGSDSFLYPTAFEDRRKELEKVYQELLSCCGEGFFQLSRLESKGKKAFLDSILTSGGEGLILKNKRSPYVPGLNGYRDRSASIKVKRTMTGALGDEIDAYVIGFTLGDEWSKKGWIAGLKLAVQLRKEDGSLSEHWIATVSAIPDEIRVMLSEEDPHTQLPALKSEFLGKVLTIDGQDISARNRRLAHARADWRRGFREDKLPEQCILDESFVEEQIF